MSTYDVVIAMQISDEDRRGRDIPELATRAEYEDLTFDQMLAIEGTLGGSLLAMGEGGGPNATSDVRKDLDLTLKIFKDDPSKPRRRQRLWFSAKYHYEDMREDTFPIIHKTLDDAIQAIGYDALPELQPVRVRRHRARRR